MSSSSWGNPAMPTTRSSSGRWRTRRAQPTQPLNVPAAERRPNERAARASILLFRGGRRVSTGDEQPVRQGPRGTGAGSRPQDDRGSERSWLWQAPLQSSHILNRGRPAKPPRRWRGCRRVPDRAGGRRLGHQVPRRQDEAPPGQQRDRDRQRERRVVGFHLRLALFLVPIFGMAVGSSNWRARRTLPITV